MISVAHFKIVGVGPYPIDNHANNLHCQRGPVKSEVKSTAGVCCLCLHPNPWTHSTETTLNKSCMDVVFMSSTAEKNQTDLYIQQHSILQSGHDDDCSNSITPPF
jgi:hypothetical protein